MRPPVRVEIQTYQQFVPCVFTANIRGGLVQKIDELEAILRANDVDIARITQTWLKQTVHGQLTNIAGYVVYRSEQKDGRCGGGVAVFVHHNLPCVWLSALETTSVETVWLLYR